MDAYKLPVVDTPAFLISQVRAQAGLSQRQLATQAGCTRSTIARIENGEMDPTVTMLARIATAAGYRLTIDTRHALPKESIATIARRAFNSDASDVPWTELRGLLDWLYLHPDRAADAITDPPTRTNPSLDNLLAAIADKIADDHDNPRPRWTSDVPTPDTAWHAPGTPRMRALEAAHAPRQLAERNIFIAETNLWRPHA